MGTSDAAYEKAKSQAPAIRRKLYDTVREKGNYGMTRDEIQHSLGIIHQTLSPRFSELIRNGYLIHNGEYRKTRSDNDACVYVVSDKDATNIVIPPKETQVAFLSKLRDFAIAGDTDSIVEQATTRIDELIAMRER